MKIAIIGAGFAAKASAHYLSKNHEVVIFDGGKGSASTVAAGLLHKFIGMHSRKCRFADEALKLSLELIEPKVKTGLIRKAQSPEQAKWFQLAAKTYPDEIELIDSDTIYIDEAWVVDCPKYLADLQTVNKEIISLDELKEFDRVVIAAGVHSMNLCEVKLSSVRGQLLIVSGGPMPKCPVSSQIYAIPHQGKLIVGSTYERGEKLDAKEELLPKLNRLLPDFEVGEVFEVKEGYRANTPDRMPMVKQVDERTWVFTGLGSKGLLYHAYFGKLLAESLM
ncbi:MAG: FAD-binding oxidoreductase [Chlamydiia bacterium]|nr:FAD-binding oxidoreductase [Chlamydiia bacterium]